MRIQQSRRRRRRRSSAGMPGNLRRGRKPHQIVAGAFGRKAPPVCGVLADGTVDHTKSGDGDSDSMGYDSEGEGSGGRRLSGEMISMKDFLQANKVSLAVMQKQLYETAQMQRGGGYHYGGHHGGHGGRGGFPTRGPPGKFTPGTVGPLAILSQKLGESGSGR